MHPRYAEIYDTREMIDRHYYICGESGRGHTPQLCWEMCIRDRWWGFTPYVLLELLQQAGDAHLVLNDGLELVDAYALLLLSLIHI